MKRLTTRQRDLYLKLQKDLPEDQVRQVLNLSLVGYHNHQVFLLDYETLDPKLRHQLETGLALSMDQEASAYKDLGMADEDRFLTRRHLMKSLSDETLRKFYLLTKEARLTILRRLGENHLMGVLDQVIDAAPKSGLRQVDFASNKLVESLIQAIRKGKAYAFTNDQILMTLEEDLARLEAMIEGKFIGPVAYIEVARELLSQEERDHWLSKRSYEERLAMARAMLTEDTG